MTVENLPHTDSLRLIDAAGLQLIPLGRRSKRPRDREWTTRPYDNASLIAEAEAKQINLGVRPTTALLVVDVDPRNFADGRDSLAALSDVVGIDLASWKPRVETDSGGLHLYMAKPNDVPVLDKVGDFPGIEFKTFGRQLVAPGSVHPLGGYYVPVEDEIAGFEPASAPAGLIEICRRPSRSLVPVEGGAHSPEEVAAMLAALDPTDFQDHDAWLNLMMACHHASGGAAREEFVAWSILDPMYSDQGASIETRWKSLDASRADGVTVRTLHAILVDAGAGHLVPRPSPEDDFDDLPIVSSDAGPVRARGLRVAGRDCRASDTISNALAAVAASGLRPAYDELKGSVVFRGELQWDATYGSDLDDNTIRLVRHFLIEKHRGNDYQPSKENVFEAVATLAYEDKFNPVADYLDGLTWDGVPRVEHLFTEGFPCGDGDYQRAVARCFMVGAVARQRRPGCKVDTMPVVQGDQGSLKSTGLRVLFGDDWFSDAEMGDLAGKDATMLLSGVWVHEFAELAGLGNSDIDVLKAFMSRAVDRIRPPYGRTVVETPRRAVFAGTVNEGGFLRDHTGGRRFWPLRMPRGSRVDVNWIASNRDQLWAEASALFGDGAEWTLPEELWPEGAERQAHETVDDPWADEVRAFLDGRARARRDFEDGAGDYASEVASDGTVTETILDEPPPGERVHTSELFDALAVPSERRTKAAAQRMRRVMEAVGWEYRRGVRVGARTGAGYVLEEDL